MISVGFMLPLQGTDSPFDVDPRALKMFLEQPILGFNGKGPADRTFGHTESNFLPHYIDTRGNEQEVLQVCSNSIVPLSCICASVQHTLAHCFACTNL